MIFALGFVTAGFVLILIEERSGNVKHLQLVCGMNRGVYWLSAFTWDLVNYAVFITVMLILFVIFQVRIIRTLSGGGAELGLWVGLNWNTVWLYN